MVLKPYVFTGPSLAILFKKPFVNTLIIALPELSGPKDVKNVAFILSSFKRLSRFGVPYFVPWNVSISILSANLIFFSYSTLKN